MMATNFEFYKDAILGYVEEYASFPAFVNGKLVTCVSGDCQQCIFRSPNCFAKRVEWLYAEHIEPPKLTKRERAFCEAVQTGWIARDCNMHLFYFSEKAKLAQGKWMTRVGQHCRIKGIEDDFIFIKDTDAECWAVEDLLKLEIGEG